MTAVDASEGRVGVDASLSVSAHSWRNKLGRVAWGWAWLLLFRLSPKPFHAWRRTLLRVWGAKIGRGAVVHPSVRIWAPWNLEMGEYSCLAPDVDCYCVNRVVLGANATVSQYSYLCTASHDYERSDMPLTTAPIHIGSSAWIAVDVFVAPGVTIGEGAVVGARSSVFTDVAPWTVAVGTPARKLKERRVTSAPVEILRRRPPA